VLITGHYSQIMYESMRPSPHRRHLVCLHTALLNLCQHMKADIRTRNKPNTLFAEPIPDTGVGGPDGYGFEIMEFLNNDESAKAKWKEFAMAGHQACWRPDVGPAPLRQPAEHVIRTRLMDLRQKHKTNWKDVRDRLCFVYTQTHKFREALIKCKSANPGATSSAQNTALERQLPAIIASEEELCPKQSEALRQYVTLLQDQVQPLEASSRRRHVHSVAEAAAALSPFVASERNRVIALDGQRAIEEFCAICDMHIKRRFLTTADAIIKQLVDVQKLAHRALGCQCLETPVDASTSHPNSASPTSQGHPTYAGACRRPWHLVDFVSLLVIHCRHHNKSLQKSALKHELHEARVRHEVAGAGTAMLLSALPASDNAHPILYAMLVKAREHHARNEHALKNLEADFRLLIKDKVKMQESTRTYLNRLQPLVEQVDGQRPLVRDFMSRQQQKSGPQPPSGVDPQVVSEGVKVVTKLAKQALPKERARKRQELAKVAGTLGKIYVALAQPENAIDQFKLALRHVDPLPSDLSNLALQTGLSLRVSGYHSNLGKCFLMLGRWRRARCHLGQALTIKMKVLDKRHASIGATCYLLACVYIGEARAAAQEVAAGTGAIGTSPPGNQYDSDQPNRIVKSYSLPLRPRRMGSAPSPRMSEDAPRVAAQSEVKRSTDLGASLASTDSDDSALSFLSTASLESPFSPADSGAAMPWENRTGARRGGGSGGGGESDGATKAKRRLHDALALLLQALMLQLHQDGGRQAPSSSSSDATSTMKIGSSSHAGAGAGKGSSADLPPEETRASGAGVLHPTNERSSSIDDGSQRSNSDAEMASVSDETTTSGAFAHGDPGQKSQRGAEAVPIGESPAEKKTRQREAAASKDGAGAKQAKSLMGFHQSTINTYCKISEVYLLRLATTQSLRGALANRKAEAKDRAKALSALMYAHEIWQEIHPKDVSSGFEAMLDGVEHGFEEGSPERAAALQLLGSSMPPQKKMVTFNDHVQEFD